KMTEMSSDRQLVTRLLQEWGNGNKAALDELMPVVYEQLRKLASRCLRAERADHTLPATALVHEAYLRLVDADIAWQDRVHFFAVSARLLRRIRIDHAKANHRQKRGGASALIDLTKDRAFQGDPTSAEPFLRQALAIREKE